MPDTPALALSAAGIAIYGVVTGLHPALMLAASAGAWWALSYSPGKSLLTRVNWVLVSSCVGAWLAPWATHWIEQPDFHEMASFPVAVLVGWAVTNGEAVKFIQRKLGGKSHDAA